MQMFNLLIAFTDILTFQQRKYIHQENMQYFKMKISRITFYAK